jgi:hypothetical protein
MNEKEKIKLKVGLTDKSLKALIIIQKNLQTSNRSVICPSNNCSKCSRFFTEMKNSKTCPCTIIGYNLVSKEFVLTQVNKAINILNQ